jgi:dihydroorotate dehydrogenase (NAD+) catalytic subunit
MKYILATYVSMFLGCLSTLQASNECLYDYSHDFVYNCSKEYPENSPIERKPFSQETAKTFLGYPIASSIGIPACAIMTSNGIKWASRAGYDILTYKTVRSQLFKGHPIPNIFVLETPKTPLSEPNENIFILPSEHLFNVEEVTMANSMGIPTLSLEWTLQDIAKARASLLPGQVLIVSIIGNANEFRTQEEDFAYLALAVVDAGAHIVEANLSCPNLHSPLATYKDPVAVSAISKALYEAVPNIPIVLKVGLYDSPEQMRSVFIAAAAANAQGICGINSIPMHVLDLERNPAFGETRKIAGVSGSYIQPKAYDFVVQARKIIEEEGLDLALIATGGVTKPEDFILFLEGGADIVLSATGAMWNPNLAKNYHKKNDTTNTNQTN